jgi:hypothetical protein
MATIILFKSNSIKLINIVYIIKFMVDAHTGWEYLLGSAYLVFNVLIIWYAWK